MKLLPLPPEVTRTIGATHKAIIEHTDVAGIGAAASGALILCPRTSGVTNPAGLFAQVIAMNLITAFDFSDTGITSLLIEVGDGGDTDRLLTQTEIAADGTEILYKIGTAGYAYPVVDTIDAVFTAANGGTPLLSECNAGKVEVYLRIFDLNELERAA